LLNGLAFIGGVDPDDPTEAARKAEIPAGFQFMTNGFAGWECRSPTTVIIKAFGNADSYPALEAPEGGDPWEGRCAAGNDMYAAVNAPDCWDGHNLTAPNGRDHFRYKIRHVNSGLPVCPIGWWQVPSFETKTKFSHNGWADYSRWYLASDRMHPNPANWRRRGSTMHFDWMNGWDAVILDEWLINCTGIKIGARPGNPHDCDYSTINVGRRLLSDSVPPDGSMPGHLVDIQTRYFDKPNSKRFFPIKAGTKGAYYVPHAH
jgi:hypothetical protein